jgi:hypothetical protein
MDDDPVLRALAEDDPRLAARLRRGRRRRRYWWPLIPALPVVTFLLLPPTVVVGLLGIAVVLLGPMLVVWSGAADPPVRRASRPG